LSLSAPISPVSIQATVIPPTPPPINPAPPSGGAARKEAKQRQAATAKSEEGADQAKEADVDLAGGRNVPQGAQEMTRHQSLDHHPFTRVAHAGQLSAWSRGALYGGGIAAFALVLAMTWRAWPGPRRRPPELPAPAWSRHRHRR
jgi:hypothetical protein